MRIGFILLLHVTTTLGCVSTTTIGDFNIFNPDPSDRAIKDENEMEAQPRNTCADSPLRFTYRIKPDKRIRRFCKWAGKGRCQRRIGISSHCPLTCGTCADVIDSTLKFKVQLEQGKKRVNRTCKQIANDPTLCSRPGVTVTCRLTCGGVTTTPPTAAPVTGPTAAPVAGQTSAPTTTPTMKPSVTPTATTTPGTTVTGKACSANSDCASNVCDTTSNICYATQECKAIKHGTGVEFDTNHIIIIFVGSGFTDLTDWQNQIQTTYSVFEDFPFFEAGVTQFSSLYVNKLEAPFCNFNCNGIQRLLCCEISKARELGNSCFPAGSNVQTVVVHNDDQYGGAGYVSSNVATTSTNSASPLVAVHELGHSLFDFYDEYTYISSTPSSASNCDSDQTCPKWNDLLNDYPSVCSNTGCSDGNYRVSESNSFMKALNYNVGPVLRRYTCCTFYSLTTAIPAYCDIYLTMGLGLYNYCDISGYAPDPASISAKDGDDYVRSYISTPGGQFIYVAKPLKLLLNVGKEVEALGDALTLINWTQQSTVSNYYGSTSLDGEYSMADAVEKTIVEVVINFDSGKDRVMYFSQFDTVAIPLYLTESGGSVKVMKSEIEIILDQSEDKRKITSVRMQTVT